MIVARSSGCGDLGRLGEVHRFVLEERRPIDDIGIDVGGRVDEYQRGEIGELVGDLGEAGEEAGVFDDAELRLAVAGEVGDLVG